MNIKLTIQLVRGCFALSLVTYLLLVSSCQKADTPSIPGPEITSFSPEGGTEGVSVKITGSHFSTTINNNTVSFNGKTAVITSVNSTGTELVVTVPQSATTGKISVTVAGKSATSATDFTLIGFTDFDPINGPEGSEVTISGSGLEIITDVHIGSKQATIKSKSATQIIVYVPSGFNATSETGGAVKLMVGSTEMTMNGTFEVTNVWIKKSSYEVGTIQNRYGYMASFYYGNKIFWGYASVLGGSGTESRNDLISYDMADPGAPVTVQANQPASNSVPAPRSTMNSTVFGTKAYIFGGEGQGFSTYNDIWEYDIPANTYKKMVSVLPTDALASSFVSFTTGGKLYISWFRNGVGNSIYEYDPVNDSFGPNPFMTWTSAPNLWYSEVQVMGDNVFFIANKTIVELNMTNKNFSTHTLPSSVMCGDQRNFVTFNNGSKIYFGGGTCQGSNCTSDWASDFYEFDPSDGSTTRLTDIPNLIFFRNPFGINNGKINVLAADGMYEYNPNK